MFNAYDTITNRVIELLEKGTIPWTKPWGGEERMPRSLASGKPYRGLNVFMLHTAGYESPFWLSYKQAKDREGQVRRGEKGYPCIFWKWNEVLDEETQKPKKIPLLRLYTVFNAEQCDGLEYPIYDQPNRPHSIIHSCENIVNAMENPPTLEYGGRRACYTPWTDTVTMPKPERFESPESYYAVLFHEMTHATGHSTRLNRKALNQIITFGSKTYGQEELVAEMGATYLCGHANIENKVIDNSASYINNWLQRIKGDNKLLVHAASQAQKAADHILGTEFNYQGDAK